MIDALNVLATQMCFDRQASMAYVVDTLNLLTHEKHSDTKILKFT